MNCLRIQLFVSLQSLRKGFHIYNAPTIEDIFDIQGCERMVSDQKRAARYVRDEADNLIEANGKVSIIILFKMRRL